MFNYRSRYHWSLNFVLPFFFVWQWGAPQEENIIEKKEKNDWNEAIQGKQFEIIFEFFSLGFLRRLQVTWFMCQRWRQVASEEVLGGIKQCGLIWDFFFHTHTVFSKHLCEDDLGGRVLTHFQRPSYDREICGRGPWHIQYKFLLCPCLCDFAVHIIPMFWTFCVSFIWR